MSQEWIKSHQSWLTIISLIGLLLLIIGSFYEFSNKYVTQDRFYHYNGEQDKTANRLKNNLILLSEKVNKNSEQIARNSEKINIMLFYNKSAFAKNITFEK